MLIILLLFLLSVIKAGHISVDDIFLTYQNQGHIKGCHIYFSLENHLEENEIFYV